MYSVKDVVFHEFPFVAVFRERPNPEDRRESPRRVLPVALTGEGPLRSLPAGHGPTSGGKDLPDSTGLPKIGAIAP
jgi:hypothetical protein